MKRIIIICIVFLQALNMNAQFLRPTQKLTETERADWLDEAKFGMFIHFGLYSQLGRGEWVMCKGNVPRDEYIKLADTFNPTKFNAKEWVAIAKNAGMKYITITSKHHDGFCLFDSAVDDYNSVDGSPFKRDILKELQVEAEKAGIKLGFYYSQAQDWYHKGGSSTKRCFKIIDKGNFDQYLDRVSIPQMKELLKYNPSHIWFDTPWGMEKKHAEKIVKAIREIKPDIILNSRLMYHGHEVEHLNDKELAELKAEGVDFLSFGDRAIPESSPWDHWETCMTISRAWGYRSDDKDWKTPETVIRQLAEIASKGGTFLLNVGPTPDGLIPTEAQTRLAAVGDWLKVNGEAVYGAEPTVLEGETEAPKLNKKQLERIARQKKDAAATGANEGGAKKARAKNKKKQKNYNWLATGKDNKVYIHLFKWVNEPLIIKDFKADISKAYFLADKSVKVDFKQLDNNELQINLPKDRVGEIDTVLCFELK